MKKRYIILSLILCLTAVLMILPACTDIANGDNSSLKNLTKPYIAEYECVEARLGEKDFLENYEYIKITLVDSKKMQVSYKPKRGKKTSYEGSYTLSPSTRELTGEIGIFGVKFKETTKIENGEFTITKNIKSAPLIMKFKMK